MQNSIISWVGGKRLLRSKIIPLIPPHATFVEVFGGAGWVLFGKSPDKKAWGCTGKAMPYTEVYNDINGELVNFWRQVKHHPESLAAEINRELVSREVFDEYMKTEPTTELGRAVRFYYLLGCSYGSQSKNFCINRGYRYLPLRNPDKLLKASERLRHVIIERKKWQDLISRYDSETTLFYLDPPYYDHERLYKRDDAEAFNEHEELARALMKIKGKFILSYNDCKEIRHLYAGAQITEVTATYSVSGKWSTETELIITQRSLP